MLRCVRLQLLLFLGLLACCGRVYADPGYTALDTTFSPPNISGGPGGVRAIVVQTDGKIIISGYFRALSGVTNSQGLLRLNTDGSVDTTFHCSVSGSSQDCLALQTDGKILVGGNTFASSGFFTYGMVRLNPDGSRDSTFKLDSTIEPTVDAIAVQSDGRIVIGGSFARGISRLNQDGSLDLTFNVGSGANNAAVVDVAIQADGKIVLSGGFTSINGVACDAIARLMVNGSVDPSFTNRWQYVSWIRSVALQPDGKIVVGGWFNN